jgi:DNA-binding transcriptional MerR regulator
MRVEYPVGSGEAARILGVTEPQLGSLMRRGRIQPPPRLLAGRRLWDEDHLIQAARALRVQDHGIEDEGGDS